MPNILASGAELASRSTASWSNGSAAYRAARTGLLAEEIELRRQIERVAERRRALPPGGEVPQDYAFQGKDGPIRLSGLFGMRRIRGETEPMGDEEETSYVGLTAEYERLQDEYTDADDLPEEVDARLGEIETAMEALQDRPVRFEPDELAISGAYVSICASSAAMSDPRTSRSRRPNRLRSTPTPLVVTTLLCRKHGMSSATFYSWKAKYGGMDGEPCPPLVQGQWRATPGG